MKSEEVDNMIDAMSKEIEDLEETIEVSLKEQKEREKYTHELESKVQKLEAKLKKCKEVYDKLDVMDYYWGDDALRDLEKIFEEDEVKWT